MDDADDLIHNRPTKYPIMYVRWPKPLLYTIIFVLLAFFLATPALYLAPNAAYNNAFWNTVPCSVTNNTRVFEEENLYFVTLVIQYERDDALKKSQMDVCIGSVSYQAALNCSATLFATNTTRTCAYHKFANVDTLEFVEMSQTKSTVIWILFLVYNLSWVFFVLVGVMLAVILIRLCTHHASQTFNTLCYSAPLRTASASAYERMEQVPSTLQPFLMDVLQDGEQLLWIERQHLLRHFPMVYCFLFSTLFVMFGILLFICCLLSYVWGLQTGTLYTFLIINLGFILFIMAFLAFALFLSAIIVPASFTFHICTSEKLISMSADLIFVSIVYAGYEELLDVECIKRNESNAGTGGSIYWYRSMSGGKAGFEYVKNVEQVQQIIQGRLQ